jgi:endonuclease III
MTLKERYNRTIEYFERVMPEAETELHYRNTYELLVAVILSAQCTDKRVNMTTPKFFELFPAAQALAKAEFDDVFPLIRSISYPNSKTKHLIGMARMLVEDFKGKVPQGIDALQKLPGVGRKTANVVASVAFGESTMPVDTHVFRVAQRIGLVKPSKTPLEVEKQLLKNVPEELMGKFHHWLILHGRYICTARNPKHDDCGLKEFCSYYKKNVKKSDGSEPTDIK